MNDPYKNDIFTLLRQKLQSNLIQNYQCELSDKNPQLSNKNSSSKRPPSYIQEISFDFQDPPYTFRFIFDIVELDKDNSIKKVFVICDYEEFLFKLDSLLKTLRVIESFIKTKVYLTFLDNGGKLHTLSSKQIKAKHKKKLHVVQSFSDFYEELNSILDRNSIGKHIVNRLFYRGQSNNNYEPIPGIFRDRSFLREDRFYREAVRRLPHEFTENMSTFDNLVKMQHYELPTRLLDITTNPLVALFFACQESKDKEGKETDGEVIIFPLPEENIDFYDSDSVSLLANLAKRPLDFDFDKEKDLLIRDVQKDRNSFDGNSLKKEELNKIICVLPKLNNERIINQDGAFFIFGMGNDKKEIPYFPERPYIINVDRDWKKHVLKELELFGISEASLFPETNVIMHQIKKEMKQSIHDKHYVEARSAWDKAFDDFLRAAIKSYNDKP